jgi:putative copper export protein
VLFAGGVALAGRLLLGPGRRLLETGVAGCGLVLVAGGGFGLLALEPAADATRFGRVTELAAIVALVGIGAALASVAVPALRHAVVGIAALGLAAPTLAGHALDPRRLRALVALADFVHVAAAAFWIGGLTLLVISRSESARRRFPALALTAVLLLGAAAIPRAIAAFPSFASLVDTGYGQAVLVKTGLLALVLSLALLNRRRLRALGMAAELGVLAILIGAVAVLTDLRPPARASAAAASALPSRLSPPPADAVVVAGQDDDVAVGLAVSPRGRRIAVRVSTLGPDGLGLNGFDVRIAGRRTAACGGGCYAAVVPLPAPPRVVDVALAGGGRRAAALTFTLPARWPVPPARAIVARADRVYRSLRTLVIHERLASNARNAVLTTYRVQAPNRLAYRIVGGPQAVIIGDKRWDRLPGGKWERSAQEPLTQPEPFWGSDPVRNARLLGRGYVGNRPVWVASFYDPRLPAWFELWIDRRSSRLLALKMTAQAHFMRHRYTGFDAPLRIVPPP